MFGIIGLLIGLWIKQNSIEPVLTPAATSWPTFVEENYNFSLKYPPDYRLIFGDASEYPIGSSLLTNPSPPTTAPVLLTVLLDRAGYDHTNLAGAWITVAVTPSTPEDCQTTFNGTDLTTLGISHAFNDVLWSESANGWVAEGAAGTIFQSKIFHTFNVEQCYEAVLHIATTNIYNYDPGTVVAVDENALRTQLQEILRTFQFINYVSPLST